MYPAITKKADSLNRNGVYTGRLPVIRCIVLRKVNNPTTYMDIHFRSCLFSACAMYTIVTYGKGVFVMRHATLYKTYYHTMDVHSTFTGCYPVLL